MTIEIEIMYSDLTHPKTTIRTDTDANAMTDLNALKQDQVQFIHLLENGVKFWSFSTRKDRNQQYRIKDFFAIKVENGLFWFDEWDEEEEWMNTKPLSNLSANATKVAKQNRIDPDFVIFVGELLSPQDWDTAQQTYEAEML